MKKFLDKDFLLHTRTAKKLFHNVAKKMPIFDFHNHLSAKEIWEDACYENLAQAWLGHDHYKWRAMRAFGIEEQLITGSAPDYDKYISFVKTVRGAIGNPLYHWTHMELQRYFQIMDPINEENANVIWNRCNAMLKTKEYSIRNLLRMQHVTALCTTDDPVDNLEYHKKLKEERFEIAVMPTFRPDRIIAIEKTDFNEYVGLLGESAKQNIANIDNLLDALKNRISFFKENGCLVSDHSLENNFYRETTKKQADEIFQKKLKNKSLSNIEIESYKAYILRSLGREYARQNMVMQMHIGALRNNDTALQNSIGDNVGSDSCSDLVYAHQLSSLLDAMKRKDELPRTILYNLNPKDNEMLAAMCGNFQNNGGKAKVQFGPAWWFNDHKAGIEEQIEIYSRQGILNSNVGMLTDSRSYLSYPRHEYYRRILCNKIGDWVETGEYPLDMKYLKEIVRGICYQNAIEYFKLSLEGK